MNLEKEKFIAIVDPSEPKVKNYQLINQIQFEIKLAQDALCNIYHQNTKIIPNNYPLPEVQIKSVFDREHVDYITHHQERKKYRLAVFQKIIPNQVEIDWVPQNGIRFIIEYIVKDSNLIWEESSNGYSARVIGRVTELKDVLLDVFVDILMEGSLGRHRLFKSIYNDSKFHSIINSGRKVDFITKNIQNISQGLNYYPISSFFKKIKNNEYKYDMPEILRNWQKYLLEISEQLKDCPQVKESRDIVSLLPKKLRKQVDVSDLSRLFAEKCKLKGFYIFAFLHKSPIGSPDKLKRQIKANFRGNLNIGKITIIQFSFSHVLNGLDHLILEILFEKI